MAEACAVGDNVTNDAVKPFGPDERDVAIVGRLGVDWHCSADSR